MRVSRSSLKQIIGATILLFLAGILFFPAYLFWNASIQRSAGSLSRCGQAPIFQGKDQTGHTIGNAQLRGRVWVANFVQLADQQEGELLSSKFAELDQNFQRTDELALVSFAVSGRLGTGTQAYAQRHEASFRWHFLDTSNSDTASLLAQWVTATAACRKALLLEKTFVLVDREGEIRGIYDETNPEVVQKILIDVGSLLRGEPSPVSAP